MPTRSCSLNARIILVVSCILLATGIASGWITARNQTAGLLAAMRANATIMVRNLAETCAHYLLVQDYAELEYFLLKSVTLADLRQIQVCEPNGALIWTVQRGNTGQPVSRTGLARLLPPASRAQRIGITGETLSIWEPIEAGNRLGWIKADFTLAAIRQSQSQTWTNTLLLTLFWVIGSSILIVVVLRPLVASIGRLTDFASQLDEKKGAQFQMAKGQPRELVKLGDSLNEASAKLLLTERQLLGERERLREREHLYRSLVDSMAEGVILVAANGEIIAVNPAAERILGRTAEQLVGMKCEDPAWQAIYDDGRPFPENLHPAIVSLQTGLPHHELVMGIHRPDGALIWISINTQPLVAPGESRAYAVVTTFHDMTERKQAEETVSKSEARYRALFENSPVSLWEEDFSLVRQRIEALRAKGVRHFASYLAEHPEEVEACAQAVRIIAINQPTLSLFRAETRQDLMHGLHTIFNKESFEIFRQEVLALIDGATHFSAEAIQNRMDGEPFHSIVILSLAPGAEDNWERVFVSVSDITDRKRAEKGLLDLNEQLDRRVRERTAELESKNRELERMNRLFVGRELRMVELKEQLRKLEELHRTPEGTQ